MSCTPSFEEIALSDGIAAWVAAAEGAAGWWTGALQRGASGPELLADGIRWWDAMIDRRRPDWSSPNEIVFETPIARLRDFSPERPATVVPTLVLPPQAGHDSCIVDFSPEQSQMRHDPRGRPRAGVLTRLDRRHRRAPRTRGSRTTST